MIVKSIQVRLVPGHLQAFLASQRIWDLESRIAPGYLGSFCGRDPDRPNHMQVLTYWRSRAEYEAWMAREHDRIAGRAGADEHIAELTTRVLDPAPGLWPELPDVLPEETLEAARVQLWSELYRCSAALRAAVQLELFDRLAAPENAAPTTADLAAALKVDGQVLERLLRVLGAMGLARGDADGWTSTPVADRTLRSDAAAYQGHMVLHNSRPDLVRRWWRLGNELGVPGLGAEPDPAEAHAMFVQAMSDTARAGQAAALAGSLELGGVRFLLDVGGGAGEYAAALCRTHPDLRATVLDLPATEPLARAVIDASPAADRLSFVAGDYRAGPLPGPVDAVLFSNVLRGEEPTALDDLLARAVRALTPGGLVIVHDLLPVEPPASPGLRAALFGLHMPMSANPTPGALMSHLERAGLTVDSAERLRDSVVANWLVVARRSYS